MIRINKELWAYMASFQKSVGSEPAMVTQECKPTELVIRQGSEVAAVYIIQHGIAKCTLQEENGKEFIQEFFSEGALIGEVEILTSAISICSVVALTELTVWKIGQHDFQALLRKDQRFNQLILQAMATKISDKAQRHAFIQTHALDENLLRLTHQFPDLTEKISKSDLANYLGITLRSLNRALNHLGNIP